MEKLSYADECTMKQKDLENLLWQVFWSYSQELGVDESEEKKTEMFERAQTMIPEFSKEATDLEADFDYPLIHLFLTSLHLNKNLFLTEEAKTLLEQKGPDMNAKLFALDRIMQERGVLWQSR